MRAYPGKANPGTRFEKMPRARITSKGRVTIPSEVRKQLRLGPENSVDLVVDGGESARLLPVTGKLADLEGMLPAPRKAVSLARMKRAMHARASRTR
jgi:AbrB family looped-hinge helix DNA binding protein